MFDWFADRLKVSTEFYFLLFSSLFKKKFAIGLLICYLVLQKSLFLWYKKGFHFDLLLSISSPNFIIWFVFQIYEQVLFGLASLLVSWFIDALNFFSLTFIPHCSNLSAFWLLRSCMKKLGFLPNVRNCFHLSATHLAAKTANLNFWQFSKNFSSLCKNNFLYLKNLVVFEIFFLSEYLLYFGHSFLIYNCMMFDDSFRRLSLYMFWTFLFHGYSSTLQGTT